MVTIIILTWNALSKTKKCLSSLFESEIQPWANVIVVDNCSKDGTVEYLSGFANEKKLTLIQNESNLGYARAVNSAIRASQKDSDILLLNNDTEILDKNWLVNILKAANSDSEIGVLGVKILRPDMSLQHCGAYMPIETMRGQQIAGGETDVNQFTGLYEVESVVFACALIKRLTIERIGLLSEDFFAYYEDSDYCDRVRQAGLKVYVNGDVRIMHDENSSTKENKVDFNKIYERSREIYINKWKKNLESYRYSLEIDWHSIINFPSGYATSSRELLLALENDALLNGNGMKCSYRYVYGKGTPFPVEENDHTDSYLLNCIKQRPFGKSKAQVVYAQGDVFEKNSGKIKIGFTMLETSGIPKEWVRQANLMDEIWVPSKFNKETFIDSGVRTPIRIVPLGVDPNYFNPRINGKRFSEKYTFFSVFEWGERKAPEILLKAFADEFSKNEEVCLVCKINNFDPSVDIGRIINNLKLRNSAAQIIILPNFVVKGYEMPVLYRSADAFVLPTRGEGWGMPILEAMACGLPVIATNWSAQTDFLNDDTGYPLEIDGLISAEAKCPYYVGHKWAQPSYEHLRVLLRRVFDKRDAAASIGQFASNYVNREYSWNNSAKRIQEILNKIL